MLIQPYEIFYTINEKSILLSIWSESKVVKKLKDTA